ncbi:hypothetical protein ASD24_25220 [Paenibacillus sp. Root52]|uniref:Uncharacterized protein n=1 Tax=Paenibacillus amylolyticus TaxID=1451 RepID=A0AAP5H3K9_PAEAM|nr:MULTISPECIES: hypothetical protein [Paenibacillus]KQY90204.1 hypothetical protein ASD24_25220 [Paenibacillus sp. Root52]MDR6725693.1 hypothetical protein [Paenibacillus amylolyticus]
MASIAELAEEIKTDKIKNEDLIVCLEARNLRVVAMAMFKLIERNYCNISIVDRLSELGELLTDNKFIGPWQFGHVAIATLSLLENEDAKIKFNELFERLSDNDKYLVDNFIKLESYKI